MLPPDDPPLPADDARNRLASFDVGDGSLPIPSPEDSAVIGSLTAPTTIGSIIAMLIDLGRALRALKGRMAHPTK